MSNREGRHAVRRWARNKQLAEYLGISVMTLHRWKRDPKLNFPAASEVNNIERNDLDLIDEWLKSRVVDRLVKEVA
jgi:uncharacterized protein YjcR